MVFPAAMVRIHPDSHNFLLLIASYHFTTNLLVIEISLRQVLNQEVAFKDHIYE